MAQDIKITPGSGTPQISFVGSGTATSGIELNIHGDSDLSYAGYQGELFNMGPALQTGIIFSVKDISGLDHIAVNASGDVTINEFYGATYIHNLPASDPGVIGQLWKDGTELKISQG